MPAKTRSQKSRSARSVQPATSALNEVHLVGRLSAPPTVKHLPSGAEVVQLRLVVDRPASAMRRTGTEVSRSPTVDTIDIACWKADIRRRAMSWEGTETLEVSGALRRRFWRGAHGVASRYEVEAETARILK